jgi:hypothetical protein
LFSCRFVERETGFEPATLSLGIEANGAHGAESAGIPLVRSVPLLPVLTVADTPLTIAFDALSAKLRSAVLAADIVAVQHLRAGLDALLASIGAVPADPVRPISQS